MHGLAQFVINSDGRLQVLDKTELVQASMVGQIKREISIMRILHHPNIVDLKEIMASRDKLYVVMELVPGGELFDQVIANGPFKVIGRVLQEC